MMRRTLTALLPAILMALFLASPAMSQSTPSFSPTALPASLSVSNVSARVVFPSPGPTALILNTGSNVAYLNFGTSTVTATTSGYPLGVGCSVAYNVSGQTYVAAITASSTTTLSIQTGSGVPTLPPQNCTQTVTVPGTVTVSGTVTANQGTAGAAGWPVIRVPSAASTSGVAPVNSAAVETGHVIKASAGNLYDFNVSANATLSAVAWGVLIFNSTTVPAAGAVTPVKCFLAPIGTTSISGSFPQPMYLGTGISIAVSTGQTCFTKTDSANAFISANAQ